MSDRKELSPQDKMRALADAEGRTGPWWMILSSTLAVLVVVGVLLCAGGIWWFRPRIDPSPERAAALMSELVTIQIPPTFQPHGTIEWQMGYLLRLRGVYYELYEGDGVLSLVEVNTRFGTDEDVRRHIRETLLEIGGRGTSLVVDNSKSRTESILIEGQEIPVRFDLAEDPLSRKKYHIVEGVFPGKAGSQILLSLRVDAERWQPEVVREMLASVRKPGT